MNEIAITGGTLTIEQPIKKDMVAQFVAYIDRCPKTIRTYMASIRQFVAWLNYEGIDQPTRESILLYREWLQEEHEAIQFQPEAPGWQYRLDGNGNRKRLICKPTTTKQYLQNVRQFFSWAAIEGIYPVDIAKGIRGPKIKTIHRKDSLAAHDVQIIEDSIDRSTEMGKRLYAMFLLAVNAGMRTVELSRANICDLETKNGTAYINIWGKGHAEADTKKPLAPEVYAAILDYLQARTDAHTTASPLFVATGNRSGGQRIKATTISTMLKRAMQAAGYNSKRLTAHSLRHTTGQNVLEITGRNIYETQMYMRHMNPATTEIYLDNDSTKLNEEIAIRLYAHYHGQKPGDPADKLAAIARQLNPDQLEHLAAIAEAMQGGGR